MQQSQSKGIRAQLKDIKTGFYRKLKYRLLRPAPPPFNGRFSGPVVVVGSAPKSDKPVGLDETYTIFTVNGSQSVASKWGISVPDLTFMMFNQVEGTTTNAQEVRRVLSGTRTKSLYVLLWRRNEIDRLRNGLKAFDYNYDELTIVDRYQRMALLDKVAGLASLELDADSKCSNGMNAVLFALYHGAPAVIICGINPNSAGHIYNGVGLKRHHVDMDRLLIERLVRDGRPLFTADPDVSVRLGIPLWTGSLPS
ncbi:membrane-anchored protein [Neorhizobium sp. NCHU2750]|uniref:membrane-anchored protein n=1 Tax=Neorhizobium sp. NCHU2750 TaxID=1825976 RepID=UPI001FE1EFBA